MRSTRVITAAVVVGLASAGATFLVATKVSGDDKSGKEEVKSIASVKPGAKGVVVFGSIVVDNGPGLLELFPDAFPQPCKVVKVKVKEGDEVKKGDALLECDTELADLTVAVARAGLAQAQGALEAANAALKQASEMIEGHQFLINYTSETLAGKALLLDAAKTELAEKERIAAKLGSPNDPDLLAARKKAEAAQKDLDAEKVKLDGMKKIQPTSKRDQAQGAVAEATAAVARQKAELEKALYAKGLLTLKAPADGRIVRSLVAEGMTYGPQSRMPAFQLQPKGPIVVRAEVDQEFASRVSKGENAVIQDDGNSNLKWTGKVVRVGDSFLPKRSNASIPEGFALNETRYLECIVSVDKIDPKTPLRVGQRVKVSLGVD